MDTSFDLKQYICGSDFLLDRLENVKKCFLEPTEVLVVGTEEAVLLWLTRLLTTKATALNPEELEASWRTLEDILNSSRLQALCEKGWVCLLSSSFVETLVSLVTSSGDSVQCHAVNITYILLKNQQFAPMLTQRPRQCLVLLEGIIKWIIEDHRSDQDIALAMMLTEEVNSYMRYNGDKKSNVTSLVDHVLLPQAKLHIALKNESRDSAKKLLDELESLVSRNLFDEEMKLVYLDFLQALFSDETKTVLSEEASKLFTCLITTIGNEALEVSELLLFEFLTSFLISYKKCDDMGHKMVVVLFFALGVSVKGSKLISLNNNNLVCRQITVPDIHYLKREALLSSLLLSVKDVYLNHNAELKRIAPHSWLQNLGDMIMKHGLHSASGIKSLQILLQINPKNMGKLILNNFPIIVLKCMKTNKSTEIPQAEATQSISSATDDLLCDVLQVFNQLREVPNMCVNILHSLLKMPQVLSECMVIPESLHIYEGNLLFPPRFMFEMMKAFNILGHTNVIATWKVFLVLLTESFAKLMDESASPNKLKLVSMAVWLLSCILRAFPILEIISVAGVIQNVAELMNQTAKEGIQPLIAAMLTLPHNNDVCGSLLVLCHTWGELHRNLCTYDKYLEHPDVSPVQLPESSQQAADFCYLMPFISSDMWAQISARVANFGNQPTQLALVQLSLQKLCHVIEFHQNNFDVKCNEESMSPTRQIIEAITKYLLNAVDVWGESSMQLLTIHLPYLIPFIHDMHLPTLAKYLVTGFQEGKQFWVDYIHSDHFLEAPRLHPHIISCICSNLVSGLSSRKRKLSESDSDIVPKKNYVKKLLTKIADAKVMSSELGISTSEVKESLVKMEKDWGAIFGKLISSKSKFTEPSGCVKDIDIMRKLLRRIPYSYINQHSRTKVMFVLLSAIVNDEFDSNQEKFDLLQTTTDLLRNQKSLNLLSVVDMEIFLQWLIQKRLTMSICVHSSAVIPLSKGTTSSGGLSKLCIGEISNYKSSQTIDTLISHEFDILMSCILETTQCSEKKDLLENLAHYVTTSEELQTDKEGRLHVAVLLLSECQKRKKLKSKKSKSRNIKEKGGESCQMAFEHISSWIYQLLKKSDLATIQPATAASLLIAHTIMISENAKNIIRNNSKVTQNSSEVAETVTEEVTPSKMKTPKYFKLLQPSVKLSELCLSSNNPLLVEHALNFIQKIGEYFSFLEPHLPADFFTVTWAALSQQDYLLSSGEFKQTYRLCLMSLILTASSEEFEKILKDLIREIQGQTNIGHSLALWQIVISSKVTGEKTVIKCTAVEHLVPLIVNLITLHSVKISSEDLLIPVVETIQATVSGYLAFSPQARALLFKICTVIPLVKLSLEYFHKIFRILVDVMNSLLANYSDFTMERIPSLLAVIGHFSEALIAHSSQDHQYGETEIKMLVDCSNSLERLVSLLTSHRRNLKRVIHFTVARMIVSLQNTFVYQEVKISLETTVYHLLDICDEHSFNHLLVALPEANTTLLKHLRKNYEEFYRYHSNIGTRKH